MYESHYQALERALARVEEKVGLQALSERFFALFFALYPQTLGYFSTTHIPSFAPRKYRAITAFLVDTVKHPDFAEGALTDEVRRHIIFGLVDKQHYFALIDTLEVLMREVLDDEWTPELQEYWEDVSQAMKGIITQAATHLFN